MHKQNIQRLETGVKASTEMTLPALDGGTQSDTDSPTRTSEVLMKESTREYEASVQGDIKRQNVELIEDK